MLLLNNDDLARVLTMENCIEVLEAGFRDLGQGTALEVGRTDVYTGTPQAAVFHRSSILRGTNRRLHVGSIRIMSDMVTWPTTGSGTTEEKYCVRPGLFCGLVMLFDTENGEPLALLQDGYIQHLTVGAGAGIGAKYLARAETPVMGVIGSGGQAQTFADAICAVRPIRKLKVFSPNPDHRRAFAEQMSQRHDLEAEVVDDPRAVCAGSDIVVTATDSVTPVFDARWIDKGTHFTWVSGEELDQAIFAHADVIGSVSPPSGGEGGGAPLRLARSFPSWAVATEDELALIPRSKRAPAIPEKTVSLIDVMLERRTGRQNDAQITICQGGGGQRFAAVGYAAYLRAKEAGLGHDIPMDWLLQTIRD